MRLFSFLAKIQRVGRGVGRGGGGVGKRIRKRNM